MEIKFRKMYWHNGERRVVQPGERIGVSDPVGKTLVRLGIATDESLPDYDKWSYAQIREQAKKKGMRTWGKKRQDLIDELRR